MYFILINFCQLRNYIISALPVMFWIQFCELPKYFKLIAAQDIMVNITSGHFYHRLNCILNQDFYHLCHCPSWVHRHICGPSLSKGTLVTKLCRHKLSCPDKTNNYHNNLDNKYLCSKNRLPKKKVYGPYTNKSGTSVTEN